MPLLPASLIEPLWVEFAALIGADQRPVFSPTHPWGCHRRRVPDRVVFEHVIAALVHGCGYERIATPGCSDRTIRRRLREWADGRARAGVAAPGAGRVRPDDRAGPGRPGGGRGITKAPCGGEVAGRSPVDRGKQGMKRSVACDGGGSRCTWSRPGPTVTIRRCWSPPWPGSATCSGRCPTDRPCTWTAATTRPRPATAGDPRLRGRTSPPRACRADPGRQAVAGGTAALVDERLRQAAPLHRETQSVVEFYLYLAAALTVIRRLINRARRRYRWPTRPTTRRLR